MKFFDLGEVDKVYKKQFYQLQQSIQFSSHFLFLMKQNHPYQPPLNKSKLPTMPQTYNHKQRNHSLKKIVFNHNNSVNEPHSLNNIGLFPKIPQKIRKNSIMAKNFADSSLQKNTVKWHLPNNQLKKRQKLHTQGQKTQQQTQNNQSFVSLTNKLIVTQGDIKDTMIDFQKKIQMNKKFIKKEIEKKNKENQSSIKKDKSFLKKKRIVSSRFLDKVQEDQSPSNTIESPGNINKMEISLKKRSSSNKKKKSGKDNRKRQRTQVEHSPERSSNKMIPKHTSEGLFTQLQVILDDKMRPETQNNRQQEKKLKALLAKLYNFKNQKQYSTQSFLEQSLPEQQFSQMQDSRGVLTRNSNSSTKLKRQTNYKDWNKLELQIQSQQITYRKSSFEQELQKISEYTDRNDASLEKYLGVRKELLKLGFQVQMGHNSSTTTNI